MENSMMRELEALRQENARLKAELEQERILSANLSRETFLSDLAGNNRVSPEEFRRSCETYHVDMPSDRFAVMAIDVLSDEPFQMGHPVPDNQENLRYVRFLIRNVLEDSINGKNRCHVMLVQGNLCAILNLVEPDEEALSSIAEAADRAGQLFEDHYETVVNFSISSAHHDYTSIPAAYGEAKSLQDYRSMAGDDSRVLRYDHLTERYVAKERVEHFNYERALGNHIRSGDYEAAKTLVHQMLEAEFGHAQPTVQVYMIRAYGIINDLLHVFDSLEDAFSPQFLVELQAGPRIVHAASLQEIAKELDDIFDAIIARQQMEEPEPNWVQRAIDYMDQNITDQNLCVATVADAININPVYLSRTLNKYRNIRPLEYIHQKRVALAKELLEQGVSVKDTLVRVGYSSALTMNRAFKKYENATPGAFYREAKP